MESDPTQLTRKSKNITFAHGLTDTNRIRFYTTIISFDFLCKVVREVDEVHTVDKEKQKYHVYSRYDRFKWD